MTKFARTAIALTFLINLLSSPIYAGTPSAASANTTTKLALTTNEGSPPVFLKTAPPVFNSDVSMSPAASTPKAASNCSENRCSLGDMHKKKKHRSHGIKH